MKKIVLILLLTSLFLSNIDVRGTDPIHSTAETYDLLIIAPSAFEDSLQPLVTHKQKYNISTKLETIENILNNTSAPLEGDDPAEQVKYCIKNAYDTWHITYVLLVGGRKGGLLGEKWWVPARYCYIEDNVAFPEERYLSDLYFADLYDAHGNFSSWDTDNDGIYSEWYANQSAEDTMDLYPEVYVGRLACINNIEVKIMVNKIIRYEEQQVDDSWFKRMIVVGGDTYTDNDYYEGEEANQMALDAMPAFTAVKLWTSTGTFTHWRNVTSEITKGCGFLYFAGHGSPSAWGTHPPFNSSIWVYGLKLRHMPLLWNGYKLPICVVGGCHNSMFNISTFHTSWTYGLPVPECWSWWLTRKIGGGAIATMGCTGLGYGKEDKQDPSQGGAGDWLDVLFFKQYGEEHIEVLGKAWGQAISTYIDAFPIDWSQHAFNDTALDAKTVQEWVLLGDPSLKIGGYS